MASNNDRNINIMLQNPQDEEDEVVISISTVIKKLKKYFLIWVVSAVVIFMLSFGYAFLSTHVIKKPSLQALVGFSYSGIEKGLDPSGRKFDPYSISNPNVIERAINSLGLDMSQLEKVREGIVIKGLTPKDAMDRLTVYESILEKASSGQLAIADKMLETSYYPTQFQVVFNYNNTTLSSSDAVNLFNEILEQYQTYFYEEYGYNESLGTAMSAVSYKDYDYSEALDVFQTNLNSMMKYVKQLSNEDSTRFRSAATGYTFDDLYQATKTIRDIDLDKISSYITVNNVTKNKDDTLAYYDYRLKALNRNKAQYEEQIASINESIESYQKDEIYIFNSETNDTNMHSTVASAQYDKMIQEKNNLTESLAEIKQSIVYYTERQTALKSKPASKGDTERIETDMENLYNKVTQLTEDICNTADDYFQNVTFKNAYSILVPASDSVATRTSSVIENAKKPLILLEGFVVVVYFGIALVEAFVTDTKKKKAEALAVSDKAEASDEPKNDESDKEESKKSEKSDKKEEKKK